jgi:hypothetical protein
MSKYEWERGTVIIPAKDWPGFRKGLIEKWNAKLEQSLVLAQNAHAACEAAARGKRGEARQRALLGTLASRCAGRMDYDCYDGPDRDSFDMLFRLIFKSEGRDGPVTLQKPKRSALGILPLTKDAKFNLPWAYLSLRNGDRSVYWDVPENNHAVESAHEHWFTEVLFAALGSVNWTPRTGGFIYGNDEYNRDVECGGGSYVTYEFSKKEQTRQRKARRHESSGGYGGGYGYVSFWR